MSTKQFKSQHFVQRGYLEAWCDPTCPAIFTPYVWLFNRDGSNPENRAPKNVFEETDFYTVLQNDGTRDLSLEHALGEFDDLFPPLRKRKLDPQLPMTPEEHTDFCAYIATAHVRTRASKRHHMNQWQHVQQMMDDLKQSMRDATPEEKMAHARIGSGTTGGKSLTYDQVALLAKHPLQALMPGTLYANTPILTEMSMLIFCTDDPIGFVTSDRPVNWFDPTAYRRPPAYRYPTFRNKHMQITMPISPRQCVLFYWGDKTGYVDASPTVLLEFNQRQVAECDERFVSCSQFTNPDWFTKYPLPDDAWETRQSREKDKADSNDR